MFLREVGRLVEEGKAKVEEDVPWAHRVEQEGKVVARVVSDPLFGETIVQGAEGEIARFTDR